MILKPSTILYINHVPKCGGTTIVDLFRRSYPAAAAQDRYSEGSVQTMLPSELAQKRLIAAHLPEWVMRRRLRPDVKIGLAREPWARFNSIVRHHLRDAKMGAPPPHVAEFTTLIAAGEMTRAFETMRGWYGHDSLTANYAADPLSAYPTFAAAAESALERIETYDLIVRSEEIDAQHALLCRLANQPESAARRLNAALDWEPDDSDPFGPECEETFKKFAAPDYKVFAALDRRAKETAKALRAALKSRPSYAQIIAARAKGRADVAVEAGDGVACAGWDRPVPATGGRHAGQYGLRMCDAEALVDIGVIPGRPLMIELVLWIGGGIYKLKDIEITVNDRAYALGEEGFTAIEDAHDRSAATVFLDHDEISDGFCRIGFKRRGEKLPGQADLWLFSMRAQTADAPVKQTSRPTDLLEMDAQRPH